MSLTKLDDFINFIDNYKKNEVSLSIGKKAMDEFSFARILAGNRISKCLSEILENDSVDENIKSLISKRTSYSIKKQKNEAIDEIEINSENHNQESN